MNKDYRCRIRMIVGDERVINTKCIQRQIVVYLVMKDNRNDDSDE